MGAFEYTALDVQGRERKGVLEGDAARQIRQQLRDMGMTPLAVEEVQQREAREQRGNLRLRRGISATDLALLTRQWATLVRSALSIEEALRTVAQQTEKARIKSMLTAVRARVMEGHSLATALNDFPHAFPELYRSTVSAGEQSGHLDVVLERLADYTESRQVLQQKTMTALIYPIIIMLVAVTVVVVMMTYVVPQVLEVFDTVDTELPLLTRLLIGISDFMQAWGLIGAGLLIGLFILFVYLLRFMPFRRGYHRFLLRIPLISRMLRGLNTARFARTFSILTASGVPVLDGLRISAQVIANLPMREAVDEVARKVREGSGIHIALEKTGYFPPMTVHLIASGEASGNLEEMLERSAIAQEREIDTLRESLLKLMEPVMILAMAGMVLFIVLAMLLPIFEMNQLVR